MEANTSCSGSGYAVGRQPSTDADRLPLGVALLAILGLSALGWAGAVAPILAIFNL